MKNHAQEGKELPSFDETIKILETICNRSSNLGNPMSWYYAFLRMRQGKYETISQYTGRVLATYNGFQTSHNNNGQENREKVERLAWLTLTTRCHEKYQECLEKIHGEWKSSKLNF